MSESERRSTWGRGGAKEEEINRGGGLRREERTRQGQKDRGKDSFIGKEGWRDRGMAGAHLDEEDKTGCNSENILFIQVGMHFHFLAGCLYGCISRIN